MGGSVITSFSPPAPAPLMLPSGRKADDLANGPLYSELGRLDIPGFSHNKGREENIRAYQQHLQAIHDEAGQAAVTTWLVSKRSG